MRGLRDAHKDKEMPADNAAEVDRLLDLAAVAASAIVLALDLVVHGGHP